MSATISRPKKAYRGMGMEGGIARWYAKNAQQRRDFELVSAMVAPLIPSGGSFLEVAPGPGFHTIELARKCGCRATGLDISETFVGIARENAREAGVDVDFRLGNASEMPFADASFDVVVCMAAFKNFSEPVRALAEMRRVLKPGGTALVEDMRRDTSMAELAREVDTMGMSPANAAFTNATFWFLKRRAYTAEEMRRMAEEAGFMNVHVNAAPIGMNVWMGDTASRFGGH